jgi:hypothetical protein
MESLKAFLPMAIWIGDGIDGKENSTEFQSKLDRRIKCFLGSTIRLATLATKFCASIFFPIFVKAKLHFSVFICSRDQHPQYAFIKST